MHATFVLVAAAINCSIFPFRFPRVAVGGPCEPPIGCDYCPSCAFIISVIFALMADKLKLAGSCIGG